jgi:ATP-binding cassette subfamily B multidrug efflux pump
MSMTFTVKLFRDLFVSGSNRQELFFSNVLRCEIGFFDVTHTADLNKSFHHLGEIHHLAGHQIPQIIRSVLSLFGSAFYMMSSNATIGSMILLLLIVQWFGERFFEKLSCSYWPKVEKIEEYWQKFREESFSNVRTIKEFSCEAKQEGKFRALLNYDREVRAQGVHIWAMRCAAFSMFGSLTLTTVWYFGLKGVLDGTTTLGAVSSFVLLVDSVRDSANTILTTYQESMKKAAKLCHTFDLMERPSQIPIDVGEPVDKSKVQGQMELRAVCFSYPSRPKTEVLRSINLTLQAGKVTALCGGSGGGKSSIAGLVLRNYDPLVSAVSCGHQSTFRPQYHKLVAARSVVI